MNRSNIVRVIVSPRAAHSFRVLVVGYYVVIVSEFIKANRTNTALFDNVSVQQLPHFSWRAEFPITAGVMGIFDPAHARLYECRSDNQFAATARPGVVDWASLV